MVDKCLQYHGVVLFPNVIIQWAVFWYNDLNVCRITCSNEPGTPLFHIKSSTTNFRCSLAGIAIHRFARYCTMTIQTSETSMRTVERPTTKRWLREQYSMFVPSLYKVMATLFLKYNGIQRMFLLWRNGLRSEHKNLKGCSANAKISFYLPSSKFLRDLLKNFDFSALSRFFFRSGSLL